MDQIEIHWVWWLIAAVALGVVEVLTLDLVLLMFAMGALAAIGANLLDASITVQVLVFVATSLVMLLGLRPYLLRNLRRRTPLVETNAAGLVGRLALTLSEVTSRGGSVKLAGEQWTARTGRSDEILEADVEARVTAIDGATAVVTGLETPPIQHDDVGGADPARPDGTTPPHHPEDRS
ncbi:NfeD family protein [Actinotalea sp. C106]|uniref:NfeD family protein n=1 Tax=Actinotalea sp. C106 TaxID=2908644 RepID=UPI00202772A5|nr:NfeD family protein [Actinotalea sp. C106]